MEFRHASSAFIDFVSYLSSYVKSNNRSALWTSPFHASPLLLRLSCASPSAHVLPKENVHRFINHVHNLNIMSKK